MSVIVVRTRALELLRKAIGRGVPDLGDRISTTADRDQRMMWPKLGVQITRSTFEPRQRMRMVRLNASEVVYEVGTWVVDLDLKLGAPTDQQRTDLGEQLAGVFWDDPERPGILVQHLEDCWSASLGGPPVIAWELDDVGFQDEMVFDRKLFAVCGLTGRLPVLVKSRVFQMDEIRLVMTADLTTADPQAIADAAKETFSITEDGVTPI